MRLAGDSCLNRSAIERDKLVGFSLLPEEHVGRQVAADVLCAAGCARRVELPLDARGDIARAGLLLGGSVEPARQLQK